MAEKFEGYVKVGGKDYSYSFWKSEEDEGWLFFECKAAKISQEFAYEDLFELLLYLPDTIIDEIEYEKGNRDGWIQFRTAEDERQAIKKLARECGFKSVSAYVRSLALGETAPKKPKDLKKPRKKKK